MTDNRRAPLSAFITLAFFPRGKLVYSSLFYFIIGELLNMSSARAAAFRYTMPYCSVAGAEELLLLGPIFSWHGGWDQAPEGKTFQTRSPGLCARCRRFGARCFSGTCWSSYFDSCSEWLEVEHSFVFSVSGLGASCVPSVAGMCTCREHSLRSVRAWNTCARVRVAGMCVSSGHEWEWRRGNCDPASISAAAPALVLVKRKLTSTPR